MRQPIAQRPAPVRMTRPTHLWLLERRAATVREVLCRCQANPSHTSACAARTTQSAVAHAVALARAKPSSLPSMSPLIVSTGLSSPVADPKHTAIERSSGASSSIKADTQRLAKMAEFEVLVTHRVGQTRSFFATVAAYGSCTPRP